MLSILIPVYNFNIIDLVQSLHGQCIGHQIPFEILCFDDGSTLAYKEKNRILQSFAHVKYQELPKNIGRAKIRNILGTAANYPYLLFMDCDSKVIDASFISTYLAHLNPTILLYGGRVYAKKPPLKKSLVLHYVFGKNREETSAKQRRQQPYLGFMTNNFLIPKSLFLKIQFEESIQGYGHEDTLFGIDLKKKKIAIKHLNNPLEHIGLEEQTTFLNKQKRAIINLYTLYQKGSPLSTKLLNTFLKCKKWKIQSLVFHILNVFKPIIDEGLNGTQPNLLFLDLYKLHYLLQIDKNGIDNLSS